MPEKQALLSTQSSPGGSVVSYLPLPVQEAKETRVPSLGREDPLEEGVAAHSNILAWRIPWSLVGCRPWGHKELEVTE